MTSELQTVVVGGGLAGLLTAAELKRRGVAVVVLDTGRRPGGVAQTMSENGYQLEPAVGTVNLPHPHLSPLLAEIGVEAQPVAQAAQTRYVYDGQRLIEVRASPKAILAPLVPVSAKLRAALDLVTRSPAGSDDESLAAMMRRHFGRRAGELIASLMATGVFAGDPERLSAAAAFPRLSAVEIVGSGSLLRGALRMRRKGPPGPRPSLHVFEAGVSGLANRLAALLGDGYRPSSPVTGISRVDRGWVVHAGESHHAANVVLAIDPVEASALLPAASEELQRAKTAPVVVAWLGGPQSNFQIPPGFGYLAPAQTGLVGIGCLFESSYAPHRAPVGRTLVKLIAGGAANPGIVDWDDDAILERLHDEMQTVLGTSIEPDFTRVVRHRPGIPQYEVGHGRWLAEVEGITAELPGLHLTGWGYRGVGLPQVAADAHRVAAEITGETRG